MIKVTDTEYNRYTYLTVAKFEERLADMRFENRALYSPTVFLYINEYSNVDALGKISSQAS